MLDFFMSVHGEPKLPKAFMLLKIFHIESASNLSACRTTPQTINYVVRHENTQQGSLLI
jgi:hypothetical protein